LPLLWVFGFQLEAITIPIYFSKRIGLKIKCKLTSQLLIKKEVPMKNIRIFTLLFVLGTLSFSCQKCYDCDRLNVDSDGNSDGTYSNSSICGPPNHIKDVKAEREQRGYTCRPA
jgi:hypothetical protein